jgi:hypothetical protein
MFSTQSPLGLTAAGIYFIALLACTTASVVASAQKQSTGHVRNWALIALVFLGLIVSRAFDIEENLRQDLRNSLRLRETYDGRHDIQRPIAAGVVTVASALGFWMTYHFAQHTRGRRNISMVLAIFAALAMIALLALRIVSLHAVDAVLYGPLKLNWITDVGASFVVIAAALYYVRILLTRE